MGVIVGSITTSAIGFDNDQCDCFLFVRRNVAMRLLFYVYRLGVWSCVLVMSYTGTALVLFLHSKCTSYYTGIENILFFCIFMYFTCICLYFGNIWVVFDNDQCDCFFSSCLFRLCVGVFG